MKFTFALSSRLAPTLLLASSLALLPLPSVFAEDTAPAPAANPALAVSVTSPMVQDWGTTIMANGAINPWQEAIIAWEISGLRITDVLADVGDEVKKGQEDAQQIRLAQSHADC